jgi:thiamine biosynthesis protein ThiS
MLIINDRDRLEWRDGMTVRGVLDAMGYEYALITVTVNGELVPEDDYDSYVVPDAAEITVFHLAHGG